MSLTCSLLRWCATCFREPRLQAPDAFSDGVELAALLARIDADFFHPAWVATVKAGLPAENVRLKTSNVKKVLARVLDYYADELRMVAVSAEEERPDPAKIAAGDQRQLGRLLQLVLGCAVNCNDKHIYIESIMVMEQSVQQVLMQAIQELMDLQSESSLTAGAATATAGSPEMRKVVEELSDSNREREELKQRCHDLEIRANMLQDEKNNVIAELENLQRMRRGVSEDGSSSSASSSAAPGSKESLRRQLEAVQEELFKSENLREEAMLKTELLEKQLEEAHNKEMELQKLADHALKLKDEVDILRETADKVSKYEATIDSYKKKLEDLGDLKRQVKILEEKNTDYMQRNMELEEDVKKTGSWKPQVDSYKKQINELRAKADSESKKSDRLDFESKRLLERVEALSEERDRLLTEKEDLKTKCHDLADEIKLGQSTEGGRGGRGGSLEGDDDPSLLEMIPPSVKERLLRLQYENKKLKASAAGGASSGAANSPEVMQNMIDDLRERENSLEGENRKANQKIMELESKLEEYSSRGSSTSGGLANVPRIPGSREELELKLAESAKKTHDLEETLAKKDVEIHVMEEKYKKYIEKAKSVIKTLDPKTGGSQAHMVGPEVNALRSQITDKDRLIETLEHETEKARAVREMEERLLSSAFYNLSMQLHRNAVENRLGQSNHASGANGQSFLARQRQVGSLPAASRQNPNRQYGSNEFADY